MLNRKVYRTSFCVDANQHILTLVNLEDKNQQIIKFYDKGYYYEIIKHIIYEDVLEIIVKRQNYEQLSSCIPSINHRTKERVNVYLLGTNLNYNDNNEGIDCGYLIANLSFRNYEITLK